MSRIVRMYIGNPLNPIVHFWLHNTAHCAEKIVSAHYACGSASAERVGQGEMHMVAARLGCQSAMVGTSGPILALAACMDRLCYRGFISGREGCLGSERVYDNREC